MLAKNCIAPLKSLPKLELRNGCSYCLKSCKVYTWNSLTAGCPVYYWEDSKIVLHWNASTKPLSQFVQYQVAEIRKAILGAIWNFSPTQLTCSQKETALNFLVPQIFCGGRAHLGWALLTIGQGGSQSQQYTAAIPHRSWPKLYGPPKN